MSGSALPGVPVIDISGFRSGTAAERRDVVRQVGVACRDIGFLVVGGHGVAAEIVGAMYDVTARFFALPAEVKDRSTPDGWDQYAGYAGVERGNLGRTGPPALVEMFHANRYDDADAAVAAGVPADLAAGLAPNYWPAEPADFRPVWRAYYAAMEELAATMAAIFAEALGLPDTWFAPALDGHLSNLAGNWYPPQETAPLDGQLRNGEHVDFSLLTLLHQDDAPGGLEVRGTDGLWHPVPPVPGTYVVNLGDLMNRYTDDRWLATPHRVVNPPADQRHRGRISIPYFVMPAWDAVVECVPTCRPASGEPAYPPVLAGPHAEERRSGARPAMAV